MSYILDALKKSDQQRQKGNGPSLQTIHRPVAIRRDSPLLKWILSILVILLLCFSGFAVWYFKTEGGGSTKAVDNSVKLNSNQSASQILNKPVDNISVATPQSSSAVSKRQLNATALRFNDLDASTRNSIPSLTFSFHVYSDNPERRTIIINNRRVREGAYVEKDLLLEEITPLGVVFIWKNEVRFSIDVVESW